MDRPQCLRKSPWIIRRQMIDVQDKLVIEDDIQHGAARQLRFRTACELDGYQTGGRSDASTNQGTLNRSAAGYCTGQCPDVGATCCRSENEHFVAPGARRPYDLALGNDGM